MTTTKTPHPAADLLRAIADGEQMQGEASGTWENCHPGIALYLISQGIHNRVRIAPSTITVNGIEVPEPMREEPQLGTKYWVAGVPWKRPIEYLWNGGDGEKRWIQCGLCHTNPAAAQDHIDAMLAPSRMDGGAK